MPSSIETVAAAARNRRSGAQQVLSLCFGAPIWGPVAHIMWHAIAAVLKQIEYMVSGTTMLPSKSIV